MSMIISILFFICKLCFCNWNQLHKDEKSSLMSSYKSKSLESWTVNLTNVHPLGGILLDDKTGQLYVFTNKYVSEEHDIIHAIDSETGEVLFSQPMECGRSFECVKLFTENGDLVYLKTKFWPRNEKENGTFTTIHKDGSSGWTFTTDVGVDDFLAISQNDMIIWQENTKIETSNKYYGVKYGDTKRSWDLTLQGTYDFSPLTIYQNFGYLYPASPPVTLYKIDLDSGKIVSQREWPSVGKDSQEKITVNGDLEMLYFTDTWTWDPVLYAFDLSYENILWNISFTDEKEEIICGPAQITSDSKYLVIVCNTFHYEGYTSTIHTLNAKTGKIISSTKICEYWACSITMMVNSTIVVLNCHEGGPTEVSKFYKLDIVKGEYETIKEDHLLNTYVVADSSNCVFFCHPNGDYPYNDVVTCEKLCI